MTTSTAATAKPLAAIERIIVPLDLPDEKQAIALIDTLPDVTFWKVGLQLFVSSGPTILQALKDLLIAFFE
ncbi:MAG: orotidine 5'-phosphate decarboxylase / HUMPS family protein, partial [Cyanobacteria bacterium J06555_13]